MSGRGIWSLPGENPADLDILGLGFPHSAFRQGLPPSFQRTKSSLSLSSMNCIESIRPLFPMSRIESSQPLSSMSRIESGPPLPP